MGRPTGTRPATTCTPPSRPACRSARAGNPARRLAPASRHGGPLADVAAGGARLVGLAVDADGACPRGDRSGRRYPSGDRLAFPARRFLTPRPSPDGVAVPARRRGEVETDAAFPDGDHVAGVADVRGRVAVDERQVGARTGLDAAAVGEPEGGRGCRGGGGECLGRGEAGLHQQFEFAVQGGTVADYAERCGGQPGVRAGEQRDACGGELAHRCGGRGVEVAAAGVCRPDRHGWPVADDPVGKPRVGRELLMRAVPAQSTKDSERGYDEDAVPRGVRAEVLARALADEQVHQPVHAGGDGRAGRTLGEGVRDGEDPAGVRGAYQGGQGGLVHRAALPLVVHDLDVVGAVAQPRVDPRLGGGRAVHCGQRLAGDLLQHVSGYGGAGAGRAYVGQVRRVRLAQLADAGEGGAAGEHVQRGRDTHRDQMAQRGPRVRVEVYVCVEQAGQQGASAPVDVGQPGCRPGDPGDHPVLDHHVALGQYAFAVEHPYPADRHWPVHAARSALRARVPRARRRARRRYPYRAAAPRPIVTQLISRPATTYVDVGSRTASARCSSACRTRSPPTSTLSVMSRRRSAPGTFSRRPSGTGRRNKTAPSRTRPATKVTAASCSLSGSELPPASSATRQPTANPSPDTSAHTSMRRRTATRTIWYPIGSAPATASATASEATHGRTAK